MGIGQTASFDFTPNKKAATLDSVAADDSSSRAPSQEGQPPLATPTLTHLAPSLGRQLETLGWVQGAVISPADHAALRPDPALRCLSAEAEQRLRDPETTWVVVSQSCDLVHSGSQEPVVEVMLLWTPQQAEVQVQHLKSPRRIQLSTPDGLLEGAAHTRFTLPREALAGCTPTSCLPLEALKTLRRFLARRYRRAAFAGEFERRWKQASGAQKHTAERVKKLITRLSPHVEMILVKGDASEELLATQNYRVSLVALIANLEDEDQVLTPPLEMGGVKHTTLAQAMQVFAELLGSCAGIENPVEWQFDTPDTLTYRTVLDGLVWDADAISDQADLPTADEDDFSLL